MHLPDTIDNRKHSVIPRDLRQCCALVGQYNPTEIQDTRSTQALERPTYEEHAPSLGTCTERTTKQDPEHLEV
jgi:hypothetical protein